MRSCQELATRIEKLQPAAPPQDVARLCLLLTNSARSLDCFEDDELLREAWHDMGLRLQAAADQHAAMTEELDQLSRLDPKRFGPEEIWTLVRAIKVQSKILQLYIGDAVTDA